MSGTDDNGSDDDNTKKTAEIFTWPKTERALPQDGVPRDEAEDLVMKALSSITGRDPAELLNELRAREAAEADDDTAEAPSNIIDLDAVRASRERASHESGLDIGDLARAGFQAVMDELLQLQPQGGELVIDGAFMRTHGPTLFGNMLQQVGKALLARGTEPAAEVVDVETDEVPSTDFTPDAARDQPTDAQEAETAAHAAPRPVEIRFDFGSLAMSLLGRLGIFRGNAGTASTPPAEAPKDTPDETEDSTPSDEPPSEA